MIHNSLSLRAVSSLLNASHFLIPDYQRGYRWREEQVVALLNDLVDFALHGNGFYCLQPLIVRPIASSDIRRRFAGQDLAEEAIQELERTAVDYEEAIGRGETPEG